MKLWKKLLLQPDATIFQALEKINEGMAQIVLIVDSNNTLLGTVTDGDIRRGLLNSIGLQSPVKSVMNTQPIRCTMGVNDLEQQMEIMISHRIQQLPLVNQENEVIGLQTINELLQPEYKDNLVVMMLGGLGKRLKPLTDSVPKPMLMIGDKPLLEHNILALRKQGFKRFCFSVGYKADVIVNYFGDGSLWDVSIEYIFEEKPLGTIGALSMLEAAENSPIVVINGDVMTTANFKSLISFHRLNKAACTVCVREYDYQVSYGVVEINDLKITNMQEKPTFKHFVNAGMYVLDPSIVRLIPQGRYFHMTDLIALLLEQKQVIAAFPLAEYWTDIGQFQDYQKACSDAVELFQ